MPTPSPKTYALDAAGLDDREILVYEALLARGIATASQITPDTGLGRVMVYRVLEDLVSKKLVSKDESEPVLRYRARHPYALKQYAENQVNKLRETEGTIDALIPRLTSLFHQGQSRPGVKFYEGKEGIIKIYEDILSERSPIDSIEEKGDMIAYLPDYVPTR